MQTDLTPFPKREGRKIVPHACRERLYYFFNLAQ
jgi:hypothetical protein